MILTPAPNQEVRLTRGLRLGLISLIGIIGAVGCSPTTEEPFSSQLDAEKLSEAVGLDASSEAVAPAVDEQCSENDPAASLRPVSQSLGEEGDVSPVGPSVADIRARGALRAGVGADGLLFGSLNPFTGELEGFDVGIAQLIADAIFGDPDKVELIPITSAERIERLVSGDVDIVVKTMTITCERWGQIDFSSVYYEAGQRLLVSVDSPISDISEVGRGPICALGSTTSHSELGRRGVEIVEADTWTGCLALFQQGVVAGVSTDDTILAGLASQDPFARVVGEPFTTEPYGIGVAKENEDLTRFINGVLEQARADGTWRDLYDQWLADALGPAKQVPSASYRD